MGMAMLMNASPVLFTIIRFDSRRMSQSTGAMGVKWWKLIPTLR